MRIHNLAKGVRGGLSLTQSQAQSLPGADPDQSPKSKVEAAELPQKSEG